MRMINTYVIWLNIFLCLSAYEIQLENNGPIVIGGTIQFGVSVFEYNGLTTDYLKFEWSDNAIPQHIRKSPITQTGTDIWNVTYNASVYYAGEYTAQVVLFKCIWAELCYQAGSARMEFEITENLNGDLLLEQQSRHLTNTFVSTKDEVTHIVNLKKTDMDLIKTAPIVRTYWFVDCAYFGITNDFKFHFNYSIADEDHFVEALVMVDFKPLLPTTTVPPSTTTAPPTTSSTTKSSTTSTTKSPATTSSTTTISTSTASTNGTSTTKKRYVRSAALSSNIKIQKNESGTPYNFNLPYVCNSTFRSTDSDVVYGHFYRKFKTKDPLSKVSVIGNNWIQPGDLMSLKVQCNGSSNFEYCVQYKKGEYNITGNETCGRYDQTDKCDFTISRYLSNPKNTIIIIIKNDVSKEVTPVLVNIYKVQKQGQLSVIVVPVAFSLVAVVSIVFGVAYYFQNRSRFIIEVADFNFGQQYSDMEYKTFRERLRDSLSNAFTRSPTPSSSEVPVWPPGRKYGSMT